MAGRQLAAQAVAADAMGNVPHAIMHRGVAERQVGAQQLAIAPVRCTDTQRARTALSAPVQLQHSAVHPQGRAVRSVGYGESAADRRIDVEFDLQLSSKHETSQGLDERRSSGSLVFQNGKLSVMAPTLIAIWGYIQIVMLFLMMMLSVLAAVSAQKISWPGIAGIVALNLMLLFGMNLSNDVFIWPQRIRKRVQQQRT